MQYMFIALNAFGNFWIFFGSSFMPFGLAGKEIWFCIQKPLKPHDFLGHPSILGHWKFTFQAILFGCFICFQIL